VVSKRTPLMGFFSSSKQKAEKLEADTREAARVAKIHAHYKAVDDAFKKQYPGLTHAEAMKGMRDFEAIDIQERGQISDLQFLIAPPDRKEFLEKKIHDTAAMQRQVVQQRLYRPDPGPSKVVVASFYR
jgi:hypothetical protein